MDSSSQGAAPLVVFGYQPVRELLRHRPHDVHELWLAGAHGRRRSELEELAERHSIAVREVSERELAAKASGPHNGVLAWVLGSPKAANAGDPSLVVLLEDIQDPRNLGALLRVCEGAGVGRVMVRDRGSAPMTPTVIKASAGASEWLAVERITNSAQEIDRLRDSGFWIYGCDPSGEPPWQRDLTGPLALCLGGEHRGLRARTRGQCDALVGLPMLGRVASLNVATAAAALLYEAVRQRRQA